ncbi:hypothetical protein ACWGIB_00040 [Streptomyces xiamenensis]
MTAGLEVEGSGWIRSTDVAAWGIPTDELWTIARHNLRRAQPELKSAPAGHFMVGDVYTASQLVRLQELITVPEGGLIVGIPHPAAVLIVALTDSASLGNAIMGIVVQPRNTGLFDSMPLPPWARLDNTVLWMRPDGRFEDLDISNVSSDSAELAGSSRFMALVARLGGLDT